MPIEVDLFEELGRSEAPLAAFSRTDGRAGVCSRARARVCMCVCVCEKERERETERDRECE